MSVILLTTCSALVTPCRCAIQRGSLYETQVLPSRRPSHCAKRWLFHLRHSTRRSKKVRTRNQQSTDDFSRALLHEISISWTRCLEKEPGPSLGFVDPNFDQARGRNVAMFVAHVVRFAQARSQCFVVLCQLGKHVQWLDVFGIVVEHALSTRNLTD